MSVLQIYLKETMGGLTWNEQPSYAFRERISNLINLCGLILIDSLTPINCGVVN